MNENQCDKYYTYEVQEMELLEDTQYALGLLNVNNERQLNSNNSITGAKLLNGVKKTNSDEDIWQHTKPHQRRTSSNPSRSCTISTSCFYP